MNSLLNHTNIQLKLTDFEIIEFYCFDGVRDAKKGYRVGDWLVVSYTFNSLWKIFRADNGKPLVSLVFDRALDAVITAQIISDAYEEYFSLWKSDPNADVFALAKWSVRNGILIYEVLNSVPRKIHSLQDIKDIEISESIQSKVKHWYGGLTGRST